MFWTLLAMFGLVVTGGFISYYGDLQGRRWGKKRVSWFGMRPKHTAILITSLTGAVIALLSVGAVMLVAPNVRDVILRGEAAINDNQRLRTQFKNEFDTLQIKLKVAAAQAATTQAAADEIHKQADRLKQDKAKLEDTNAGLDKVNGALVNGNMELQRARASLDRSIQQKQRQVIEKTKENDAAALINVQLGRQNTNLYREKDTLVRERTRLVASNDALKGTNDKLIADNARLGMENAELTKNYATANKAYVGLLDENEKALKSLQDKQNALNEAYARMKGQFDDLTQQRDDLSSELAGRSGNFVRAYMELRQARYSLRADTELARRTVDAHLGREAVKEELMKLLKDASDRARQYGAAVGENGRAVAIVRKRVVTPASIQMADESASLAAIADELAGSNTPVVVVARAINNSLTNEQVVMELSSFTSTIVFKQGEVVATRSIDARQPLDRVVESVIRFLKEDVRNAAIKSGTIPQISPDTGEQEVGMIDTPDMVALVDRIQRMGGTVQLTAVANETLTSADLLTFGQARGGKPHNLRFDLKRARGKMPPKRETAAG